MQKLQRKTITLTTLNVCSLTWFRFRYNNVRIVIFKTTELLIYIVQGLEFSSQYSSVFINVAWKFNTSKQYIEGMLALPCLCYHKGQD